MEAINKILRFIDIICALLLTCITIIVFYEVLSRYFFNRPWPPSNELTTLIFPWMVFLCAISITINDDHLKVTFLKNMLPIKIRYCIEILIRLLTLLFAVLMCKSGAEITILAQNEVMPVLSISKLWLYLVMPLSFLGIILVLVIDNIIKIINRHSESEGESEL